VFLLKLYKLYKLILNYVFKETHRSLTDKTLLKDMRRAAKKLGKMHIAANVYDKIGAFRASTITRRFGSWNDALSMAGLKITKIAHVETGELMANLKKVWDSLGRQPVCAEMVKPLSRFGYAVYSRRFGAWSAALKAFVKHRESGNTKSAEYLMVKTVKARKTKYKRGTISKGMRYDVLNRDNFKCRCGANPAADPKVKLHVDHIIPRAKGGETTPDNLQTLCNKCNLGKGDS